MTIDEAIKVNSEYLERYGKGMLSKERFAAQLGIEALKRVKYNHQASIHPRDSYLPGETEEEVAHSSTG